MTALHVAGVIVDGPVRGGYLGSSVERLVLGSSLAYTPAVVAPARAERLVIDLFAKTLAHVANDERSCFTGSKIVEAVAPRITPAEGPDFVPCRDRQAIDKRIVRRYLEPVRVANRDVHVDPQEFPEQTTGRLRMVVGNVVEIAAVAEADIEIAIGTKHEISAVMVGEWLRDELVAS